MSKYKVGFRGWWYLFQPKWYSFYRWSNPHDFEGIALRVVDFGAFYFSKLGG